MTIARAVWGSSSLPENSTRFAPGPPATNSSRNGEAAGVVAT
jgi:hypothetical protein